MYFCLDDFSKAFWLITAWYRYFLKVSERISPSLLLMHQGIQASGRELSLPSDLLLFFRFPKLTSCCKRSLPSRSTGTAGTKRVVY